MLRFCVRLKNVIQFELYLKSAFPFSFVDSFHPNSQYSTCETVVVVLHTYFLLSTIDITALEELFELYNAWPYTLLSKPLILFDLKEKFIYGHKYVLKTLCNSVVSRHTGILSLENLYMFLFGTIFE